MDRMLGDEFGRCWGSDCGFGANRIIAVIDIMIFAASNGGYDLLPLTSGDWRLSFVVTVLTVVHKL